MHDCITAVGQTLLGPVKMNAKAPQRTLKRPEKFLSGSNSPPEGGGKEKHKAAEAAFSEVPLQSVH
jgi:hypothetical protein